MPRRQLIAVALLALLLACSALSTGTCDCAAARTHFIVFGQVQKAGTPVPDASVVVSAAPTLRANPCDSAQAPETLVPEVSTDSDGRFRATVYSVYGPALRCVNVTARRRATAQDSVTIAGLRLQFRFEHVRPDSVGLVLQLP